MVSGIQDAYKCGAVVYAIPDEFDCILGISFVEDVQPQVDWRGRRIEGTGIKTLRWERTGEAYGPIEEGGPVIVSGLRRSVEAKDLSAKRPDPCRDAALETNVTSAAGPARDIAQEKSLCVVYEQQEDAPAGKGSAANDSGKSSGRGGTAGETEGSSSARGKDNVVEKMFTMGVVDESGVQTKYITRKKLRKFTRVKTKSVDEPDFMLVLTNETIKQVARSLCSGVTNPTPSEPRKLIATWRRTGICFVARPSIFSWSTRTMRFVPNSQKDYQRSEISSTGST
ncbi:hypothetical protein PC116_g21850 [Phytophthora cactorum]|nr:hypothetical protein Pcac1_g4886 [Phytophthora cactorum]KAG4229832.1 hypothetical protein PC116_g21850 [Phytophthora cactorum]